jgi:hypothetical protein
VKAGQGKPLAPGAHASFEMFAILRGPLIRANVVVTLAGAQGGTYSVYTPFAHVTFSRFMGRTLHLVPCGTDAPCLRLAVPPGVHLHGPKLFASVARTVSPPGSTMLCPQRIYLQSFARTITPGCTQPTLWRVVAGYVNQPIASYEYRTKS